MSSRSSFLNTFSLLYQYVSTFVLHHFFDLCSFHQLPCFLVLETPHVKRTTDGVDELMRRAPPLLPARDTDWIHGNQSFQGTIYLSEAEGRGALESSACLSLSRAGPPEPQTKHQQTAGPGEFRLTTCNQLIIR